MVPDLKQGVFKDRGVRFRLFNRFKAAAYPDRDPPLFCQTSAQELKRLFSKCVSCLLSRIQFSFHGEGSGGAEDLLNLPAGRLPPHIEQLSRIPEPADVS